MLVGHEKLAEDFEKLAEKNKLAHGYLFFGERRVGKKLFASCLGNFLETREFSEPKKVLTDFLLIEPDKAPTPAESGVGVPTVSRAGKGTTRGEPSRTIGIDQIRQLKSFFWQKPTTSKRRTVVISDSGAMTGEAQNAILKIAEEPPESSLLIIVSSDPDGVWPTLRSRLQNVYFPPVSVKLIADWLQKTGACQAGEEAKKLADMSFGQPGLALLFAADKDFQLLHHDAEKFLKSGFWERRGIVKAMLENENFNLPHFLEILLIIASSGTASAKKAEMWHKVAALRRDSAVYNVNPRLQLEALLS